MRGQGRNLWGLTPWRSPVNSTIYTYIRRSSYGEETPPLAVLAFLSDSHLHHGELLLSYRYSKSLSVVNAESFNIDTPISTTKHFSGQRARFFFAILLVCMRASHSSSWYEKFVFGPRHWQRPYNHRVHHRVWNRIVACRCWLTERNHATDRAADVKMDCNLQISGFIHLQTITCDTNWWARI